LGQGGGVASVKGGGASCKNNRERGPIRKKIKEGRVRNFHMQ